MGPLFGNRVADAFVVAVPQQLGGHVGSGCNEHHPAKPACQIRYGRDPTGQQHCQPATHAGADNDPWPDGMVFEDLDGFACAVGMSRTSLHTMPANNFIAVWTRGRR